MKEKAALMETGRQREYDAAKSASASGGLWAIVLQWGTGE
jgi:hypothetical protein